MSYVMQPQDEGTQSSSRDLAAILNGLLRHWKLIITVPVMTFIATYAGLQLVPSLYKSSLEILVFDPQRRVDNTVQTRISPFDVDAVAINTEVQVIKSKSVARQVVNE